MILDKLIHKLKLYFFLKEFMAVATRGVFELMQNS